MREGFEFALEMRGEVQAEPLRHRGVIERQIAHDAHDGFAADFVFLGHDIAASERRLAGVERGVVFRQIFFVLPVGIGDLRNG